MSRKIVFGVAMVALLAGFFVASPYWALHQMRSAAEARQGDRLASYVDFPAVRESIRTQFAAMMATHTKDVGKDNPFAAFGNMLAATMASSMVDAMITPDGLARMMEQGKLQDANASAVARPTPRASETSPPSLKAIRIEREYEGLDVFKVTFFDPSTDKPVTQLVLNRDGLFGWKLKAIRLLYMDQPR